MRTTSMHSGEFKTRIVDLFKDGVHLLLHGKRVLSTAGCQLYLDHFIELPNTVEYRVAQR